MCHRTQSLRKTGGVRGSGGPASVGTSITGTATFKTTFDISTFRAREYGGLIAGGLACMLGSGLSQTCVAHFLGRRKEVPLTEWELTSSRLEVGDDLEAIETYYQRGWTDGLPVVPPTEG